METIATCQPRTPAQLEARDASVRGHWYRFPNEASASINYHDCQDGRHAVTILSGKRERTMIFASAEEARAKWTVVVAGWKAQGGRVARKQRGGFGAWVWVR